MGFKTDEVFLNGMGRWCQKIMASECQIMAPECQMVPRLFTKSPTKSFNRRYLSYSKLVETGVPQGSILGLYYNL